VPGVSAFTRLWLAHSVSQVGTQVSLLALPLTALVWLGAGPAEMGILAAVEGLPWLAIGLPAGAWVDRVRRRPLLVAADLGRAGLLLLVPLLAVSGSLRMEHLYVIGLLSGACTVVFESAAPAYLPSLVQREDLVQANSKLEASRSVAEISGPALGGWLVSLISPPLALLADAASFVVSGACLGSIRATEAFSERREQRRLLNEVVDGLHAALRHPVLRATMAASGTFNFFDGMLFSALYLLFVTVHLGIEPALVGALFAIGSVGGLLGAAFADRLARDLGLGRTLCMAAFVAGTGSLLIPLAGLASSFAAPLLVLAEVLVRGSSVIFGIGSVSLRQTVTPDRLLGRVTATARVVSWGSAPLGALLGGALGEAVGVLPAVVIGALGTLLASGWLVLSPVLSWRE